MRRIHLELIGITAVICVVVIYVFLAKPVLVLPTITIPLSENNVIGAYQRQLRINELNIIVRTNGKLSITADNQQLANLSYTLDSLNNSSDLAQQMFLPSLTRTTIRLFPFLFPQEAWKMYLSGLYLYYVLPVEINIRIVRG